MTVADDVRRRRSASRRLPPMHLADHRRDPLDPPRPMQPVLVRVIGQNSVEFEGPGVMQGIRTLALRHMRSRTGRGLLVQSQAADDLMAWLEGRGYRIEAIL